MRYRQPTEEEMKANYEAQRNGIRFGFSGGHLSIEGGNLVVASEDEDEFGECYRARIAITDENREQAADALRKVADLMATPPTA